MISTEQQAVKDLIERRVKDLDITETELAQRCGWNKQNFFSRKTGSIGWTAHTLARLARGLEVDPDEVFAAAGMMPPDLALKISASVTNIKVARQAMGMPAFTQT